MNYPELQLQHDLYSDHFQMLHNDISLNIALNNTMDSVFKNSSEFAKHCKHNLDILIDKAPPITAGAKKKLAKIGLHKYVCKNDNESPRREANLVGT
jgi:hypothetical protein